MADANPAAAATNAAKAGISRLWGVAKSVLPISTTGIRNCFMLAAAGLAAYALLAPAGAAVAFQSVSGLVSTSAEGIWLAGQKTWGVVSGIDWGTAYEGVKAAVPS